MIRKPSLGRTLRSRRIAVWLLAAVAAWSFIATIVPQSSSDPAGVAKWAADYGVLDDAVSILGLHSAFTAPIFLAVMTYLAVSTLVCAWERTGYALRVFGRAGHVTQSEADRLRTSPSLSVPVADSQSPSALRDSISKALRSAGLRVSDGEKMAEGRAGRWALFGSPIFHWALVLLILVIAGGRLMRSEGQIGVPVGGSEVDLAESYRQLEEGPLFPGHTGLEIAVPEMDRDFMDGEVNRGAAPVVVLSEDGVEVVSQLVYPNNPLKYGVTTIHVSDYGLSPELSLETSAGEFIADSRPLIDLGDEEGASTSAVTLDLTDAEGSVALSAQMSVPADTDEPSLDVMIVEPESGEVVVGERLLAGEAIELPDGELLRFVATGDYARLSIVHDWSVPFIYALLVIGLAGLSVAVLDPYRRVLVMAVDDDGEVALNALIRHGRSSAIFEDRVREALEKAAGTPLSLSEEDR